MVGIVARAFEGREYDVRHVYIAYSCNLFAEEQQ